MSKRFEEIVYLLLSSIKPDPEQPRGPIDDASLKDLSANIKRYGVKLPIRIRRDGRIISGERRWRASILAGLLEIPCIVEECSKEEAFELALYENTQRQDLNPLELAKSCQKLIQIKSWSKKKAARYIGISPQKFSDRIRLLELPNGVQELLATGELSFSLAKELFAAPEEQRDSLAKEAIEKGYSVRALKDHIRISCNGGSEQQSLPISTPKPKKKKPVHPSESDSPTTFETRGSSIPSLKKAKKHLENCLKVLNTQTSDLAEQTQERLCDAVEHLNQAETVLDELL